MTDSNISYIGTDKGYIETDKDYIETDKGYIGRSVNKTPELDFRASTIEYLKKTLSNYIWQ